MTTSTLDTSRSPLGDRLAAWVVETPLDSIPEDARRAAALLLLDSVGIALANRAEPFTRASRRVIASTDAAGPCTVIGDPTLRTGAEGAAEANSVAIHGSDLDATHVGSIIHPTSVAVPVALAVGEATDATGGEALAALACGMESLVRLGLAARGRYHVRGYQPTALLGPVVGAMMTARLRRHGTTMAAEAAGLSTAIAAGLRSFSDDGTWGKRLITGWACRAGIHAEALVAAGYRGSRDALEKRWGLFPAFLPDGGFDLDVVTDGLGEHWTMLDTEPKRYACSHGLHPYIESARSVRHRFDVDDVVSVDCRVNSEAARWWFEPASARYAPDAYGARFSIPYVVARALRDGDVSDAAFEDDAVRDAAVLRLTSRVRPLLDPALETSPPVGLPGAITVTLADGTSIEVDAAPPAEDAAAMILARFRRASAQALEPDRTAALERSLLGLENAPSIRDALAPLRDPAAQPPG